jgi:adenosylmethionine-8-amino-7-oxononanoate aminotransferase
MPDDTTATMSRGAEARQAALDHLWMHNRSWTSDAESGRPPIITSGNGIHVTDAEGREWIDVNGGYMCVNIGYGRTELADAMREQMSKLIYFPQGSTTEPLVNLAAKLAEIAPGNLTRSWPVTGGSEANETAIKIARAYHRRRGESGRYKIISRVGSYHGALGATMWLGGDGGREDYEPAFPGMLYAPQPDAYNSPILGETDAECAVRCAQAVEDLIKFHGASSVAAVVAEPVSSSMGAAVPGDEYWPMLRQICDRYGVILIADEVITGFGRTGSMFAMEHWNVTPDIMTMAKGITSSYVPLANAIVTDEVADVFAGSDNIFKQALTFGGHPVTAAVALKNIEIMETEGLVDNSASVGAHIVDRLNDLAGEHPMIGNVRGRGLLMGVELVADRDTRTRFPKDIKLGNRLSDAFESESLILRCGDDRIGIGPSLCITHEEADELVNRLDRAITKVEGGLPS